MGAEIGIIYACQSRFPARSSGMASDTLSDVLSLVKAKSVLSAGLRTGGDWSMRFPPPDGIKFNAVAEGA
jgi:hypothetical protein